MFKQREDNAVERKHRAMRQLGLVGAVLLLVAACAPPARVALPTAPLPKKAEVVVPEQLPPTGVTAQPPALSSEPAVAPVPPPQVVVKERYILPDQHMYAARYRRYEELKKKYDELLFHLDWLSTEKTSPELRQCVADIASIVDGYGQAIKNEATGAEEKPADGEKPWQVVWQDLAFVQGSCAASYKAKVKEIAGQLKQYKGEAAFQAGELVSAYAEQKKDQKAIEAFKYLTENFPEWKRDPAILRQYGEVLLRQGKLQEASAVFSELLGDPNAVQQTMALYRKSADLLLAVGKLGEASRQLHVLKAIEQAAASGDKTTDASLDLLVETPQKREPLLSIYQNFLREYYSYNGKDLTAKANTTLSQLENFFPDNPLTENAKQLYASMQKQTRSVAEGQLAAASRLADAKKYDQAKELLTAIKTEGLSPDLREKIRFAIQEITFNKREDQKSDAWEQEQKLDQLWQQTTQLYDQHKFDEVIKACDTFVGTRYDQQAAELVAKAVEQAAIDLRKQAAALYLKARRENDANLRGGYLQESLALLREIETKYPQATIMEKVKSNIAVLEKEIAVLGISDNPSDSKQLNNEQQRTLQ